MRSWIVGSLALLVSAGMAHAANLVTNGDFSGGADANNVPNGWSVFYGDGAATPAASIGLDTTDGNPAPSGNVSRTNNSAFYNKDFLYQLIPVTPGTTYTVNADWKGDLNVNNTGIRNWAEVYVAFLPAGTTPTVATGGGFGDDSIRYKKRYDTKSGMLNMTKPDGTIDGTWDWESILKSPDTSAVPGPTDGSFTATDSEMLIGFNIGGRAGAGLAHFNVDNVSVTGPSAVPEPASLAIGGVMSGLLILRRRRTA